LKLNVKSLSKIGFAILMLWKSNSEVIVFLIGTAFLIAASISLLVSQLFITSVSLILMAFLIVITGFLISKAFLESNYLNDLIIRQIESYIMDIEKGEIVDYMFVKFLFSKITEQDFKEKHSLFKDLYNAIKNRKMATHPSDPENGRTSGLALLIPFGFTIFGALVFFGLLGVLAYCYHWWIF
jgi:hypothetical protein